MGHADCDINDVRISRFLNEKCSYLFSSLRRSMNSIKDHRIILVFIIKIKKQHGHFQIRSGTGVLKDSKCWSSVWLIIYLTPCISCSAVKSGLIMHIDQVAPHRRLDRYR